jgi:two-component system sensor histidine kinase YesM
MKKGRISSRSKLIVWLIIPSTILVFAVIGVAYEQTTMFIRQTQDTALSGTVQQVVRLIETQMNDVVLNMIGIEDEIKHGNRNDIQLQQSMNAAVHIRSELIRGIVFKRTNEDLIGYPEYFWGSFSDKELSVIEKQTHNSHTNVIWSEPFNSYLGNSGIVNRVSIVTKEILDDDGNYLGDLSFVIDVTNFLQRSAAFAGATDTQSLLYDANNQLIYSITIAVQSPLAPIYYTDKNTETLERATRYYKDMGKYVVVSSMIQAPYWKVVVVGDIQKLEKKYRPFVQMAWTVFLIGIAGLVFIYIVVSWWFTRPITVLTKGVRQISKGNLDYTFSLKRQDEFGELSNEFNRMMNKIKELINTLKITEENKRQSDFQVLLSQINPHFLYNTLNTIDIMVDHSNKDQLHLVIQVLTRLLQYGLDSSTDVKPLRDELINIRDYLYIQSVRYADRFDFSIVDPPEALSGIKVLKLILQPIVENAVFHGLHPLSGRKGTLTVSIQMADKDLYIEVADNGVGMDEEQLERIRASFSFSHDLTSNHIGIRNVYKRIQLYYGASYGLTIESALNLGTVVTIRLKKNLE